MSRYKQYLQKNVEQGLQEFVRDLTDELADIAEVFERLYLSLLRLPPEQRVTRQAEMVLLRDAIARMSAMNPQAVQEEFEEKVREEQQ